MKKHHALLVGLVAVLGLAYATYHFATKPPEAPPAPPTATAPPTPQSFTLANGLAVALVPKDCGDQIGIALVFDVGPDHDPPERSGMTALLRRALARPDRAIEGGSGHTALTAAATSDRLKAELERLATVVTRPDLDEASLARAQKEVLDDIAARRGGDAMATARTLAVEAVQPSRGRGRRGGITEEVEPIDLEAATAFWRERFAAKNARLVLVGRFDLAVARADIESIFGALPAGAPPELRPPGEATVIGTLVMGDAPSAIALAVPAPPPSDPAYPAFLVLAARLLDAGKDRWTASYDPIAQPETLFVTGTVPQGEAPEPAAAKLRDEVTAAVAKDLAPHEVAAAKKRFAAFLGETCEAPGTTALARARHAQLGVGESDLVAALDGVTQADLTAAAAHFDAKRATAVIAGGALEPPPTEEPEPDE